MAEDFFYILGKVRIKNRGLTGFLLMDLRKRNALRNGSARWFGGRKHRQEARAIFNDHFSAGAHVRQECRHVGRSGIFLGDVDYVLRHAANYIPSADPVAGSNRALYEADPKPARIGPTCAAPKIFCADYVLAARRFAAPF